MDLSCFSLTCVDKDERESRKTLRGCPYSPMCSGCELCVCFGCPECRFMGCNCRTCVDFYQNAVAGTPKYLSGQIKKQDLTGITDINLTNGAGPKDKRVQLYYKETWEGVNRLIALTSQKSYDKFIFVHLATKSTGSIFERRRSVASTMMPSSTKIGIVLIHGVIFPI
ncbi:Protein ULTRAPETALA 2 [Vitis vinifera]|uniref:Protein ULTRAPETALA 2 n=1 Tax=Vitis vinifera TaxID=29760 RepID=A0A438I8X8_VITVI|nr:Protein ULTRAPETALA 2 [Vitis vinifera]